MLLQITKCGLTCNSKPACKCLDCTCYKFDFVLAHIYYLDLCGAKVLFFFDMCKKYANFVKNTWQKREAYLIAPAFCIPLVCLWYRKSDLQVSGPP